MIYGKDQSQINEYTNHEAMIKHKKAAPFVVFGPSKSGTTWLQKLLDSHPDIRCHFQLTMLPLSPKHGLFAKAKGVFNQRKSPFKGVFENEEAERKYFNRQKYLGQLQKEIEQTTDRLKANKSATEQADIDEFKYETLRGIFEAFLYDDTDKKIFGNKAYTDLGLLFKIYPDAKVVNIIRDGRDVCVSKRFHTLRMGAHYHGDEKNKLLYQLNSSELGRKVSRKLHHKLGWFGEDSFKKAEDDGPLFSEAALEKMATDWALVVQYILDWQAQKPGQMLLVHYEEMKAQPLEEVARILAFLGAENSDETVQAIVDKNSFSKLKSSGKNSFFRKGTSGDWKNHFTEDNIRLFKKLTNDLLVRLNYEKDTAW